MVASSTSAMLSSTPSRPSRASILWARRRMTAGSAPRWGPPRTLTATAFCAWGSALRDLLGILEELGEPGVRQRVLEQLLDHREGHGGHVRADERRLHEVHGMA